MSLLGQGIVGIFPLVKTCEHPDWDWEYLQGHVYRIAPLSYQRPLLMANPRRDPKAIG